VRDERSIAAATCTGTRLRLGRLHHSVSRVVALATLTLLASLVVALLVTPGTAAAARTAVTATPPTPTVPDIEPIEPVAPIPTISTPTTDTPFIGPTLPSSDDDVTDSSDAADGTSIGIELPDVTEEPSNAVVLILVLSVLSIAPSILVMMTSFTRIVIVMSLTRNALGIPQLPPQQVIVGLSLFLTLFVMGPTLSELNEVALQPLLDQEVSFTEAAEAAEPAIRGFMMDYTREAELELFLDASGTETPVTRDEVPLTALIPAFVLSELKSAFILGFMIMIPFLVIDLVVSAVLTSLGMMMLPPTFVSLPLKILLFVLLDGWVLVTGTLLESYA
jgi:flagellar biosynthesis protein FliP